MRILLAEDERDLSRALVAIFKKNNYSVDAVYDGQSAIDYLSADNYDVAVLDIMMPKADGLEVVKTVRRAGNRLPILLLTAKSEVDDKIRGLDSGADDYLSKPFDVKELLARIRALTRRGQLVEDNTLACFGVTLNRSTFEISGMGGTLKLSNKEFQMLEMLMLTPGKVISTERFMEKIWGYDSESEINVVWTYLSYLRKKLLVVGAKCEIKAKRNLGYFLEGQNG